MEFCGEKNARDATENLEWLAMYVGFPVFFVHVYESINTTMVESFQQNEWLVMNL